MANRSGTVPLLERVEAVLRNRAVYELAQGFVHSSCGPGGRPRHYPTFMILVYEALIAVYGSARQVDAELSHPTVWQLVRTVVLSVTEVELPELPMRRHHYLYGRGRALADPEFLKRVSELHRRCAAEQALDIGLLDPAGPGSWTHPHPTRVVYGDGKVVTPLYRAKPGDRRVDPTTGEIKVAPSRT
jgi:hypothetical protein